MNKILILGGTREAAELASKLSAEGNDITSSLAGRTKEPKPLEGAVRIGGYGGPEGLASYLQDNDFDMVIDATHPFAAEISRNAERASQIAGIPLKKLTRPEWQMTSGDRWTKVDNLEAAREKIPSGARVLLALGRQHIDLFSTRDDVYFLVRMVDKPEKTLPLGNYELLIGKPATDWKMEVETLKSHKISHIVARNSGGPGAYAKIEAARAIGIPVIMISRSEV